MIWQEMITCTETAQTVASDLAAVLEEPLVTLDADGSANPYKNETVESDDRVVIVASTTTSDAHLELLDIQERAAQRDPNEIITVIPYMGYARQDKSFEEGEPISARAVAKAIGTGTDRVYAVNPHNVAVLDYFGVPSEPIDAAPELATSLPEDLEDPVFLGPDEDAVWLAESVQEAYGTGHVDNFDKLRHSATEVKIDTGDRDFTGCDIVLVDDMIATGGTMSEAIRMLKDQDTGRVFVTCVHPVLAKDAISRLSQAGVDDIYATNTIDRSVSRISAAAPIAQYLE
jgi:ribose-phosphate pyrophosphokinase